jgi:hypothetical protein
MTVDLSKQLRELQKSTDDLNGLTDKANEVVRRTEAFLTEKCRVGKGAAVEAPSVHEDNDDPNAPMWETYLEYGRYKGDFRILVTHVVDGDPQETKPWAECSRDLKLKTLDALPKLIGELHKKVREQVADVQAKVDLLDGMIPAASELQPRPSASRKG